MSLVTMAPRDATVLTGLPIVVPIASMQLDWDGVSVMAEWVKSRRPECIPDEFDGCTSDYQRAMTLFTHGGQRHKEELAAAQSYSTVALTHNEMLVELAGRKCYDSFGKKVGRSSNADFIANTQKGDIPHACYDETTEVLTSRGWKAWPSVTESDFLATRAANGNLEYCKPTRLFDLPYSGRMYSVEGNNVDLFVTPNHNMLVCLTSTREGRERDNFELIAAQDLDERSHCYVKDAEWCGGVRENLALMKLLGFAIGDGYITDRTLGTLLFHLRKERKIVWLRAVCRELGLELREHDWDGFSVRLTTEQREFFSIYDERGEKQIPAGVICASDRISLEALWEGLLQSDGHISASNVQYSSTSRKLLDQVQQLLLHIGLAGHLRGGEDQCPQVNVVRRGLRPEVNRGSTLPRTRWIEWSGRVYCAEVPNHTLYVRRNGTPVWCGNSIMYHAKMSFFIAGVSRRVSHELIRNYVGADRDEEGSPSQESTRYTHHYGNYIAHPYILDEKHSEDWRRVELGKFTDAVSANYQQYLEYVDRLFTEAVQATGQEPKGIDRKRIYESASPYLSHACETSWIWTTNPIALAKMFRERDNDGADLEFRRLAKVWKKVCLENWPNLFPQSWMRE